MGKINTTNRSGCITFWLDNPFRRNAIDDEMLVKLLELVPLYSRDPHCRVIVVRGAGNTFCAGRDLLSVAEGKQEAAIQGAADLLAALRECPTPTLAVVQGHAVGLGMAITCVCDFVIADETARFGVPEAKLGLTPSITAVTAIRSLPRKIVSDMLFAGRFLNAVEAAHHGLANQAVSTLELDATVNSRIERIRAFSPNAIARAKRLLLSSEMLDGVESMKSALGAAHQGLADADAKEGLLAFREKRPPRWATADDSTS